MTTMVRKQVYIKSEQDELLKQWAEETGKSEAEIFRQALDRWLENEEQRQEAEAAWEQILAFSGERAELNVVAEGRSWTREELYEERLNRYDRRTD